ncbi:MAG TPA: hypothetical protein DCG49_03345 [Ruminococcus sp.]|nr:hypothetical protein [Ruminococcus sp.]
MSGFSPAHAKRKRRFVRIMTGSLRRSCMHAFSMTMCAAESAGNKAEASCFRFFYWAAFFLLYI